MSFHRDNRLSFVGNFRGSSSERSSILKAKKIHSVRMHTIEQLFAKLPSLSKVSPLPMKVEQHQP